jgi:peptide/nickel transport system permease protein
MPIIIGRLPTTIELAFLSVLLSSAIAIPLGVICAVSRNGWVDFVARLLGLAGLSVPNFWLATMLIIFASFTFQWSPALIYVKPTDDLFANLKQMLLPTISLGVALAAIVMRMTRSAVLELLGEDFVRTAYAKGLRENVVLTRHVLRNAMIPVVTIIGLQAGYLLGGVVVIEQLFGLPGLGWTLLNGIYQRDYPVVQGTVLFFALVFALFNLLVDLTYAYLDPRIRYS